MILTAVWLLLAILLALGVALLATPVHVALAADVGETGGMTVAIRPLGGFSPAIRLSGKDLTGKRRKPERPKRERRRGKQRSTAGSRFLKAMPGLIRSELSRIHLDRLHLGLAFGFADPADTGRLYGQLQPLAYTLPALELDIRPDFTRPRLDVHIEAAVHLTPLSLAVPVLKVLLGAKP